MSISRGRTNVPRRGDKVWLQRRHGEGFQPNGRIVRVDYDCQTVLVSFYDDIISGHTVEELDWSDLEGCFRPEFGGYWHVEEIAI